MPPVPKIINVPNADDYDLLNNVVSAKGGIKPPVVRIKQVT